MHPRELYFFKKGELEGRHFERNRLMALIADDKTARELSLHAKNLLAHYPDVIKQQANLRIDLIIAKKEKGMIDMNDMSIGEQK